MKKAIVTGANGFLGSALCSELTSKNIEVIAVVKDEKENVENISNNSLIRIVYCDLACISALPEIISDRDVDVLYHLAWIGSAGPLRGDVDIQLKNVQYTCDVVKVCAEIKCFKIVFASSIMEYEIEALMKTDRIPEINTLYSSAKVAADYMARTVAGKMNIKYIRAVISNIYGPGEMSPRLINSSLRKLLSGEHCAFSLGNQIYDFIYITDAAKAFVAIGEKGVSNRTYYIGSQEPKPLREFLYEMRDQVDKNINIGLGEIDFNGISLKYDEFDVFAVEKDTGFVPKISFTEGVRNTITWLQERIYE